MPSSGERTHVGSQFIYNQERSAYPCSGSNQFAQRKRRERQLHAPLLATRKLIEGSLPDLPGMPIVLEEPQQEPLIFHLELAMHPPFQQPRYVFIRIILQLR